VISDAHYCAYDYAYACQFGTSKVHTINHLNPKQISTDISLMQSLVTWVLKYHLNIWEVIQALPVEKATISYLHLVAQDAWTILF
jgi:hypothetical protein